MYGIGVLGGMHLLVILVACRRSNKLISFQVRDAWIRIFESDNKRAILNNH